MKSFVLKFTILLMPILLGIGFFSTIDIVVKDKSNFSLTAGNILLDEFDNPVNENVCRARRVNSSRIISENEEEVEDFTLANQAFFSIYLNIKDFNYRISLSTNKQYFYTRILPERAGPKIA